MKCKSSYILVGSVFILFIYILITTKSGFWFRQLKFVIKMTTPVINYSVSEEIIYSCLNSTTSKKENEYPPAIIFDSILTHTIRFVGGTSHYFHMAEHLFPYLTLTRLSNQPKGDTLLLVFKENFAVNDLSPFVRLLLTSILVKTQYRKLFFIWTDNIINGKNDFLLLNGPHLSFVVDLDNQHHKKDLFVRSSNLTLEYLANKYHKSSYSDENLCAHKILQFSWDYPRPKTGWFNSLEDFNYFTSHASHICQMKVEENHHLHTHKYITSNITISQDSKNIPIIDDTYSWYSSDERKRKSIINPPIITNANKLFLIYQRDKKRSIDNLSKITHTIKSLLNEQHTNTNGTKASWVVETVTHSDLRSPCELLNLVRHATVLLTPHGFQSILLLFQPPASILIEIHPYMYYMPFYFGTVQSNLRSHINLPRSYFAQKSISHSTLLSTLQFMNIITERSCGRLPICRYFSRLQNVTVSDSFIKRFVSYITFYFQ